MDRKENSEESQKESYNKDSSFSDAEKERLRFFSLVSHSQKDAALLLWKQAKKIERDEGYIFDWNSPLMVYEQLADYQREKNANDSLKSFTKKCIRQTMFVDLALGIVFKTTNKSERYNQESYRRKQGSIEIRI